MVEVAGSESAFVESASWLSKKVRGLQWLAEWADDNVDADDDFHLVDEVGNRLHRPLAKRLYLMAANQEGLAGLLRLWDRWQAGAGHTLAPPYGAFQEFFRSIVTIRWWNHHDRLDESGLIQAWRLDLANRPDEAVLCEIEAWSGGAVSVDADLRRGAKLAVVAAGGTLMYEETYPDRDALGRITSRVIAVAGGSTSHAYGYHPTRGWLAADTIGGNLADAWSYDERGNRTGLHVGLAGEQTAGVDDQDKLLTQAGEVFSYDLHGRVVQRSLGGLTASYTWDALGHLVKAVVPSSQGGTATLQYVLDPTGRRVVVKKNNQIVAGYLYDGALRVIGRVDSSSKLTERYVYGSVGHSPDFALHFTSAGGVDTVGVFVHDQVGSVVGVVKIVTATGARSWDERVGYDAWGVATVVSGGTPVFQHPFGFAGGLWDRDTGLVRFGAREYDPRLGRWLGRDPIGFGGGWNQYSYVLGDPVGGVDPSGLVVLFCIRPVNGAPFFDHHFLCTSQRCGGGFPGPHDNFQIRDEYVHDLEGADCVIVPNAAEQCVDAELQPRIRPDEFSLLFNNCHGFASETLDKCRRPGPSWWDEILGRIGGFGAGF